jgi:hypothetical protein
MKIRYFFLLILLVVFGLFEYIDRKAFKIEGSFPREFSNKAPSEYLDLIKNNNFRCINTVKIKERNEISNFSYDRRYYLQIYKLDNSYYGSLKTAIKENYQNDYGYHSTPYELNEQNCAEFRYKLYVPGKPSNIYFSLFGRGTQNIKKNDSIALYHSNFKNLSIRFLQDADDDIYAKAKQNNYFNDSAPIEILFLKRHSHLYLLFMSVDNGNRDLKPGMLYDLIK